MIWIPLAISVGAVLGALGRYYATLFWVNRKGKQFPYGTLFVNLTGAFLIGFLSVPLTTHGAPVIVQGCIVTGFLGAFTTFSSYILDTANLFNKRQLRVGFLYWLGSPVLGFICVKLGVWIGTELFDRVHF